MILSLLHYVPALICAILVGRLFYRLAFDFYRPPYKFMFIGLTILFGTSCLMILLLYLLTGFKFGLLEFLEFSMGFYPGILTGVLASATTYYFLNESWKSKRNNEDVLDQQ